MKKTDKLSLLDVALPVLALAFLLGLLFVFGPCGPKDDGGWMTCPWAGQAVTGLAAEILVLSILHLFLNDAGIKQGLDLAVVASAALAAVIPGRLIHLCMMHDMRCRAVMTPAVTVFAVLLAVVAAADLFLKTKKK